MWILSRVFAARSNIHGKVSSDWCSNSKRQQSCSACWRKLLCDNRPSNRRNNRNSISVSRSSARKAGYAKDVAEVVPIGTLTPMEICVYKPARTAMVRDANGEPPWGTSLASKHLRIAIGSARAKKTGCCCEWPGTKSPTRPQCNGRRMGRRSPSTALLATPITSC